MAQSAHTLATEPRTITVRVRTLVILAVIAAMADGIWWATSWAAGLTLQIAPTTSEPLGLPVAAQPPAVLGGPAAYRWRQGGRYIVQLVIHNTASIPVTITGADHTGVGWVGAFSGPTLENTTMNGTLRPGAFHAVRVPADGWRMVSFVFHANTHALCAHTPGGSTETDAVTVHFTAAGVFHDTQTIPLGDMAVVMLERRC